MRRGDTKEFDMPIVEYTASLLVGAGIGEKITQFKEQKTHEAQEILLAELRSGRREDATFSLDEEAFYCSKLRRRSRCYYG